MKAKWAHYSGQIFWVILILSPFLLIGMLSFGQHWEYPSLFPAEWTGKNWGSVFTGGNSLGHSLLLSLSISLSVALLTTLFGFITARQIAYSRYQRFWQLLSYFPFVLSPVIYAATLNFFFVKWGLAGSMWGVIVAQLLIAYPFAVILCSSFWSQNMQEFESLVATLGGSLSTAFRKVFFPMGKGILLITFFQTFLISWFEYGLTALIGVGKVQTLPIKVFSFIQEANIFYAAVSSLLLILPPLVLLWINKRFVFAKMMTRA